jgi:hypothetical protein
MQRNSGIYQTVIGGHYCCGVADKLISGNPSIEVMSKRSPISERAWHLDAGGGAWHPTLAARLLSRLQPSS